MGEIDWDKCYEDTKKLYDSVNSELITKIKKELEGRVLATIYLENYPPHVQIIFQWDFGAFFGKMFKGDKKYIDKLVNIMGDFSEKYDVNCKRGHYTTVSKRFCGKKYNKKKFIPAEKEELDSWVIYLDFNKYKK